MMETFKIICAWGLIWFFFIMMPVQLIRLTIQEGHQKESSQINFILSVKDYCQFVRAGGSEERTVDCVARLGKKLGKTVIKNPINPD